MHYNLQVRNLLGEEEVTSGSGAGFEVENCLDLSYLHVLCNTVTLHMEWQSLNQSSHTLWNMIDVDEGLGICQWLKNNVVINEHIQSLFNICQYGN